MPKQPPQWQIEFYQDARNHRPVEAWLDELDAKDRARVRRTANLLAEHGTQLGMTAKTPTSDLEIAERRLADYQTRYTEGVEP